MLGLLMPLAGLLGLEAEGLGKRLKGLAIAYAFIAILAVLGVGFLLAAGFIALSAELGALVAALIFAGAFLILALIVYLGLAISESKRRRLVVERKRSSETGAFLTTAALTALPLLARSPLLFKLGIPAAAIAAVALLRDKNPPNS